LSAVGFTAGEAAIVARFGFDEPPVTVLKRNADGAVSGIDWESSPLTGGRGSDAFRPSSQCDDVAAPGGLS
jgi:hypothetical protein